MLASACAPPQGDEPAPEVAWPTLPCDPIVPEACGLPFPSNVFTRADEGSPTGRRLALAPEAMPVNDFGVAVDPSVWNRSDGFSPGLAPMTFLAGATATGLPRPDDIARSLDDDSPTVLLDADSGERIPHWAELDMTATDPSRRALFVRPAVRLADARRYIVAIRDVRGEDGLALAPSEAFAALRDGSAHEDPSIEARRGLYADVFARLRDAGVPRDTLQLAWDFTTASRENNTAWLVSMRDQALALVGDDGPQYTIDDVALDPEPGVAMLIEGTMRVPLFLDQPGPGAHLLLGVDGMPTINTQMPWADYPFLVLIPPAAMDGPLPLAQFGHGLFSDQREIVWFEIPFASSYGYVLFATDWIGMHEDDEIYVGAVVDGGHFEDFATVVDRQMQGMVNQLLAMRMMIGGFADEPMIQLGDHAAYDPAQRYYYGSSQGGILGGTYMALTTDVERGMLDTAGQPYNLLLPRSADFDAFFEIISARYDDPLVIAYMLALAQILWDRVEPTGYSYAIAHETLPGTPAHQVYVRPAIGDHQVTTLGAHVMARAIGAAHLDTGLRDVYGLESVAAPYSGPAALVEYDFGHPPEPLDNVPARACGDPHDVLRTVPEAQQQLDHFLRTGELVDTCNGHCSFPELSGCE